MDSISLQGKTNFFEKWVNEYTNSGVTCSKQLQTPLICAWWTVLKHATSPIYISTYLSMLPKLALEVTDLIHGSLLFGNSNCQMLCICYAGSIPQLVMVTIETIAVKLRFHFFF
jgi:hypothetical protein